MERHVLICEKLFFAFQVSQVSCVQETALEVITEERVRYTLLLRTAEDGSQMKMSTSIVIWSLPGTGDTCAKAEQTTNLDPTSLQVPAEADWGFDLGKGHSRPHDTKRRSIAEWAERKDWPSAPSRHVVLCKALARAE
jgi:hypothetical protein